MPKGQIKRIFPTFLASLLFIIFYHIIITLTECQENKLIWLQICSLVISFGFASLGVIFLRNVAWTVIEVKNELAKNSETKKEVEKEEKIESVKDKS